MFADLPPPPQTEYVYQVNEIKDAVRGAYAEVAEADAQGKCCGNGRSCCGVPCGTDVAYTVELGYSKEDLKGMPEGANMSLGCGNPQKIADLKEGEAVLDLGSGGGFDAFLASKKVGPKGIVFGVDMTPIMISKARKNAEKGGFQNVEFLLGEIEHLPLPDNTVDVVISNCVINLSTDKPQVFKEAYRVLKKGGRIAISDIVAYKPLPSEILNNKEMYCGCISGALPISTIKAALAQAGFTDIRIEPDESSKEFIKDWAPGSGAENYVVSAKIKAIKAK